MYRKAGGDAKNPAIARDLTDPGDYVQMSADTSGQKTPGRVDDDRTDYQSSARQSMSTMLRQAKKNV
jgi:hypothetical protein